MVIFMNRPDIIFVKKSLTARGTVPKIMASRGAATLELLIAIAVMVLFLSGAVMVSFGGQTAGLDVYLTNHGLYKIGTGISETIASVLADWNFIAGQAAADDIYTETAVIKDISPCLKIISYGIFWTSDKNRGQNLISNTLISNTTEAKKLGGGCDPSLPEEWDTAAILGSANVSAANTQGSDLKISVINGKYYGFLTTSDDIQETSDFWVIDVSNPAGNLTPIADINIINSNGGGSSKGLSAVEVADNYAFTIRNDNIEQLQVIDISSPLNPVVVATSSIPNAPQAVARSIFYYGEKLYIGTQYLPCPSCDSKQNNELHIFNVSNPLNPVWQDSINVDRNVNSVVIREELAYLAIGPGSSAPYTPLRIYNIDSNSADYLSQVGVFETSGNHQGRSIYLLGNKIYLGRDRASGNNKDFHIIDVSNPSLPQEIGSQNLNLSPATAAVTALMVQGDLAFLGTSDSDAELQIFNISDPSNIKPPGDCGNTLDLPEAASGMVFANDLIFASIRSVEALKIIYDTPDICL
jgi:hypothetical protein